MIEEQNTQQYLSMKHYNMVQSLHLKKFVHTWAHMHNLVHVHVGSSVLTILKIMFFIYPWRQIYTLETLSFFLSFLFFMPVNYL